MLYGVYCVYDSLVESYGVPFFMQIASNGGHALAKRTFKDLVNDSNSTIYKNPRDFLLFHLGDYDDQTGILTPSLPPFEKVAEAFNLVEVKND